LVAELHRREARPGLRIARADQGVEQVARRVVRRGLPPFRDHPVEDRLEVPREPPARGVDRARRLGGQQEVEEGRAGDLRTVALERGPERGAVPAHPLREE
jgi:hypothetical protein